MYPTKKEILAEPSPLETMPQVVKAIQLWKEGFYRGWRTRSLGEKMWALQMLAEYLCLVYKRDRTVIIPGKQDMYLVTSESIYLKEPPSLISFLHEMAHHLFGEDETQACRWSVWLFKECFTSDYKKLIWDQHLLVKPSSRGKGQSPSKTERVRTAKKRATA